MEEMIDHDTTSKISRNFYSIMFFFPAAWKVWLQYNFLGPFWRFEATCWMLVNYELIGLLPNVAKIWGTSGVCETIASFLKKFYPPAIKHLLTEHPEIGHQMRWVFEG